MNAPPIDPQIVRWLNAVRDGMSDTLRQEAPNLYLQRASAVDGKCLDSAICSHLEWRDRLEAFLAGPDQVRLEAAICGRDDLCALGRWIHGPARDQIGASAALDNLTLAHREYHRVVGEIVGEVQAGQIERARRRLGQADYLNASWQVIEAVSTLAASLGRPA